MTKKYIIRLEDIDGTDTLIIGSTLKECYKLLLQNTNKLTKTTDITNAYHYVLRNAVWTLDDMETDKPDLMTKQLEDKTKELKTQLHIVNSTVNNLKHKELLLNKLRDLLPLLSDKRLEYIFNRMDFDDVAFNFDYAEVEE